MNRNSKVLLSNIGYISHISVQVSFKLYRHISGLCWYHGLIQIYYGVYMHGRWIWLLIIKSCSDSSIFLILTTGWAQLLLVAKVQQLFWLFLWRFAQIQFWLFKMLCISSSAVWATHYRNLFYSALRSFFLFDNFFLILFLTINLVHF